MFAMSCIVSQALGEEPRWKACVTLLSPRPGSCTTLDGTGKTHKTWLSRSRARLVQPWRQTNFSETRAQLWVSWTSARCMDLATHCAFHTTHSACMVVHPQGCALLKSSSAMILDGADGAGKLRSLSSTDNECGAICDHECDS